MHRIEIIIRAFVFVHDLYSPATLLILDGRTTAQKRAVRSMVYPYRLQGIGRAGQAVALVPATA